MIVSVSWIGWGDPRRPAPRRPLGARSVPALTSLSRARSCPAYRGLPIRWVSDSVALPRDEHAVNRPGSRIDPYSRSGLYGESSSAAKSRNRTIGFPGSPDVDRHGYKYMTETSRPEEGSCMIGETWRTPDRGSFSRRDPSSPRSIRCGGIQDRSPCGIVRFQRRGRHAFVDVKLISGRVVDPVQEGLEIELGVGVRRAERDRDHGRRVPQSDRQESGYGPVINPTTRSNKCRKGDLPRAWPRRSGAGRTPPDGPDCSGSSPLGEILLAIGARAPVRGAQELDHAHRAPATADRGSRQRPRARRPPPASDAGLGVEQAHGRSRRLMPRVPGVTARSALPSRRRGSGGSSWT